MNFLSSEALVAFFDELWADDDGYAVRADGVAVEWEYWTDAGDYPNNLAVRPLPDGPWYVSKVTGQFVVSFCLPKAWACEANGEPSFKFDDEGPCEIVAFLTENELIDILSDAVFDAVRSKMEIPKGEVDDSLDSFRVMFGEVTLTPAGHETTVEIEARVESI